MEERITKDTIISEAIRISPDAANLLFEEGIHCVGCGVSGFESIEEGLSVHGKTDEEVEELVKRMNDAIPKKVSFGKMFITEKAIKALKEMLSETDDENSIRIAVTDGCGGFEYDFSMVKSGEEGDVTITENDLTIHIEKKSEKLLVGATLDFVDTPRGSGFHIDNPNTSKGTDCDTDSCEY